MSMFVHFSVMPLRISTITGFVFSVLGAIGGAMAVAEALSSGTPPGWASLFAAVLVLSGMQLRKSRLVVVSVPVTGHSFPVTH
jgi:hypothetical protein